MFDTIETEVLVRLTAALAADPACSDDAERVEQIRALEQLTCAAEARQAALAVELTESRGTALELALARRESHHRGRQHLGLARVASRELPHIWAAWRAGRVSEWRVTLVARETGCLSLADRQRIDAELAADPGRLEAMGDREVVGFCRSRAAALDPAAAVARRRKAESERCVTIRPAPDCMVYLTGLLPVSEGVAAYATLVRAADSARVAGDPRTRGQVMADTLVTAVRGASGPAERQGPAATINVVMTDRTLFGTADDPAWVDGYGVADADLARELAHGDRVWLRRMFADPEGGELVAMDSRSRIFPAGLKRLIRFRDQSCRTPWCDAPVRHTDHLLPRVDHGATSLGNGQALCEACNQAKRTTGWIARPRPGPGHTIETTTPSGHTYRSRAPAPPGFRTTTSRAELTFREVALAG
ncbi:HNH endonuclease [Nocardioides sp. GXQ0305]|uniref:HNH endonuclease n=1 Tax=Nocardioides sp. GXQ0305 TaxID=3423912 RepID=UPI003D7D14B3